jgi:hypothetical protein
MLFPETGPRMSKYDITSAVVIQSVCILIPAPRLASLRGALIRR